MQATFTVDFELGPNVTRSLQHYDKSWEMFGAGTCVCANEDDHHPDHGEGYYQCLNTDYSWTLSDTEVGGRVSHIGVSHWGVGCGATSLAYSVGGVSLVNASFLAKLQSLTQIRYLPPRNANAISWVQRPEKL